MVVSLRTYLERVIAEKEASAEKALDLQRSEYTRRLGELNNEAERLKQAVAANVSSDTWAAFSKSYEERHHLLEGRLSRMESFQGRILGAFGFLVLILPIVTALIVHFRR